MVGCTVVDLKKHVKHLLSKYLCQTKYNKFLWELHINYDSQKITMRSDRAIIMSCIFKTA